MLERPLEGEKRLVVVVLFRWKAHRVVVVHHLDKGFPRELVHSSQW